MLSKIGLFTKTPVFIGSILLLISFIQAQVTSRIFGTVMDKATGDPLPGVNVIVKDTYLGAATDMDGDFIIINVPLGAYELEASMIGYKTVTITGVKVIVDRIAKVSFEMEESVIEGEVVVVVADRDILHKEVSNSQQVVTPVLIEEAPGIREVNDYLGTQAGITDARLLTVRGGSAEQTGTLVDGLHFNNLRIGKAGSSIPISAIEQISMQTGGFSAEYGNYRSGILNIITKSGDKNKYHVNFDYSRNVPHMKRFGKSLYDPTNWGLRSYMDPYVAFKGTTDPDPQNNGWHNIPGIDSTEAEYLKDQYVTFVGWETAAYNYNRSRPVEEHVTAMDLYLWNAWMHQAVPDFETLESLYLDPSSPYYDSTYVLTEKQKQALRDHAHEPEGEHADWNIDFGFGGPIPFVSKSLGDATFHLSHKSTNLNYVQPVMRDAEKTSTTLLTLKSELSEKLTLTLNGIYRKVKGVQTNFPTDGDVPDLEQGGDTMPINNLDVFVNMSPHGNEYGKYFWQPTMWQPKDQTTVLGGLSVNYVIDNLTYIDFKLSYSWQKDFFEPKETRDHTGIINFGPIWVDEMPYGVVFTADTVYNPNDPTEFYGHDEYENPPSVYRRFSSKVGEFYENSITTQLRGQVDLSRQMGRYNFMKTGLELTLIDMDNDNWRWWQGHDTIYEMRDHREPYVFGGYIQDQISLEKFEARVGVRFDYYNSGEGWWPTGDPYNEEAFTAGDEADNIQQLREDLESGKHVVWSRWRAINKAMGGTFLEKTKNFLTISPRIGIAFPITGQSKFYFNYGHFRSLTPYSEQFMYKMRFYKQGIFELGNPNLEPPRTISYELGVAYNPFEQYLIELSMYYKDISGESADIDYTNIAGTVTYDSYLNNRWENDLGFEAKVSKIYGDWLTGWINFWYMIDKSGNIGQENAFEDPIRNQEETSMYNDDENPDQIIPKVSGNISFHTPFGYGPEVMGFKPLEGWMLSILATWQRGELFTWNPADIRNLENNIRWPDYHMVDLKLSKSFSISGVKATVYLDIKNVFNTKVSWMHDTQMYRDEHDAICFEGDQDREDYLASLHLPMYDSPEYDDLRNDPTNQAKGYYTPGNDKVGDLRSKDKPYINDPNNKMFLYGLPRDIWFGIKFNF
jgi:outer membrane receptor protein involved in Fe transport